MPSIGTGSSRGASPAADTGEPPGQDNPGAGLKVPSHQQECPFASLLALSDERDQWQRVALAREREAGDRRYREGFADGYREGYEARAAELEQAWHEVAHRVAHGDPHSFAELEELRRGNAA